MGLIGTIGQAAGKNVRTVGMAGKGAAGLAWGALRSPWYAKAAMGAAAYGAYSLYANGTPRVQAIPNGPAVNEVAPGMTEQKSNFDMGASGDLVFALHRLNH